uniref:Uncharacterized protein n=1 Tax=Meiothermus ruber TaxID=277 RepID=A0A7C3I524_MEIRU
MNSIRQRLQKKGIQIFEHPRLVLRGTAFSVWERPEGGYIKTYEIEPEMEATYPSQEQVWRWLKLHLAGLPCRGIGLAGLKLLEQRLEARHAQR